MSSEKSFPNREFLIKVPEEDKIASSPNNSEEDKSSSSSKNSEEDKRASNSNNFEDNPPIRESYKIKKKSCPCCPFSCC